MNTFRQFLLGAILTLGLALNASAYNDSGLDFGSAQTLRGIQQVILQFDGLSDKYAPYGLQRADLEAAIVEQLRSGQLQVSRQALASAPDDTVQMVIQLRVIESGYYYYSYSISLNIIQRIPLARENTSLSAKTWGNGINGITTSSEMGKLKHQILTLVDEFIAAHQQQN